MAKNQTQNLNRLMEEEIQRQQKEAKRGPKSSPKDPIIHDSNRTKLFNSQFMENIGQAMSNIPEVLGHGICITKVITS